MAVAVVVVVVFVGGGGEEGGRLCGLILSFFSFFLFFFFLFFFLSFFSFSFLLLPFLWPTTHTLLHSTQSNQQTGAKSHKTDRMAVLTYQLVN